MDGVNLFFIAVLLNIALTVALTIGHRSLHGVSPLSEVSLFVSAGLWALTLLIRIGTDLVGLDVAWAGALVRSFFYAGVFHVAFHWLYELSSPRKSSVSTPMS